MHPTDTLIAKQCIAELLAADYLISVYDGEETTLSKTRDPKAIYAAMATTDEDYLFVYHTAEREPFGWVRFVYGNEPGIVINDYTTNLEPHLTKTNALADRYS